MCIRDSGKTIDFAHLPVQRALGFPGQNEKTVAVQGSNRPHIFRGDILAENSEAIDLQGYFFPAVHHGLQPFVREIFPSVDPDQIALINPVAVRPANSPEGFCTGGWQAGAAFDKNCLQFLHCLLYTSGFSANWAGTPQRRASRRKSGRKQNE